MATEITLQEAQPGDIATRMLAGTIPMDLKIAKIHEGLVFCVPPADDNPYNIDEYNGWTFDQETGVEEDAELGWGKNYGVTGSIITKVIRP